MDEARATDHLPAFQFISNSSAAQPGSPLTVLPAQTPIKSRAGLQAFFGVFSAPFRRRDAGTDGHSAAQAQAKMEDRRWQMVNVCCAHGRWRMNASLSVLGPPSSLVAALPDCVLCGWFCQWLRASARRRESKVWPGHSQRVCMKVTGGRNCRANADWAGHLPPDFLKSAA